MLNKKSLPLYIGFGLVAILGVLHFSATFFYLYWVYWWFDGLMHFLAGLAGGFATYWVLVHSGVWKKYGVRRASDYIWATFICVMIVGVAWEIFEYTNGITDNHEGLALDILLDLILDGSGAAIAAYISTKISKNG